MNVIEALENRQSIRAFLDKDVELDKIKKILNAASYAPSGVNTQPWQVTVLSGSKKQELQQAMEKSFRKGKQGKMDYQYYPSEWEDPYRARRKECGLLMYSTLRISREDKEKQINQWAANYRAFDAPVMLLFFMDSKLETGSFLDYGMFLQSIMLAAVAEGLATCPQAALGEYPEIVKDLLGYDRNIKLICGIALGYADKTALINSYRTSRESINTFTNFFVD